MRTGIVIRQGRRVEYEPGDASISCRKWVPLVLAVVALVSLPIVLYRQETFFLSQQLAFHEVHDRVLHIQELKDAETLAKAASAGLVHFTNSYDANVGDDRFDLNFNHTLKLQRYTEYCQWQEISHEKCQSCTRTNSEGKEENYACHCVTEYTYVKAWRSHLIPSLLFDQPAHHHNPLRDPFPSGDFFSNNAVAGSMALTSELLRNLRARMDPLTFTAGGQPTQPSFGTRLWHRLFGAPDMRYEDVAQLRAFRKSDAHTQHHFVYTNTWEGWFFSAYEEAGWFRLLRGFGQYLEGSLMDWQIGDLYDMVNGCTPGDIRVRYFVADPDLVSVVGKATKVEGQEGLSVVPFVTSKQFAVGLLHAGDHSAEDMFRKEEELAHWSCICGRLTTIASGIAATYLLTRFGLLSSKSRWPMLCIVAAGTTLILVALVWLLVYGLFAYEWTASVGVAGVILLGACHCYDPSRKPAAVTKHTKLE